MRETWPRYATNVRATVIAVSAMKSSVENRGGFHADFLFHIERQVFNRRKSLPGHWEPQNWQRVDIYAETGEHIGRFYRERKWTPA